jgi:hypothetical protein
MKKLLITLFLTSVGLAGTVHAQATEAKEAYSNAAFAKARDLDILYNLIPVHYTKEQLEAILESLEKAQERVKDAYVEEYKAFSDVSDLMNKSITDATDKGALPTQETRDKLTKILVMIQVKRYATIGLNSLDVLAVLKKTLTKAQLKTAADSLEPTFFEPNLKPEELTQDKKLTIYVKQILLDRQTYPLLVAMSKTAK